MKNKATTFIASIAITGLIASGAIVGNSVFASHVMADGEPEEIVPAASVYAQNVVYAVPDEVETDNTVKPVMRTVEEDENGATVIVYYEDGSSETFAFETSTNSDPADYVFVEDEPSEAESAIQIATSAIVEKYALTDATLARFTVDTRLNITEPNATIWCVEFQPEEQNDFAEIGCYFVMIDTQTGDILNIMSAADGRG